jgi:hypothetical protein
MSILYNLYVPDVKEPQMIKPPTEGPSDAPPDDSADSPADGAPPRPGSTASRSKEGEVGDAIKRRLKSLYDEVVGEPVPDKHRKLLDELARKSGKDKPGK